MNSRASKNFVYKVLDKAKKLKVHYNEVYKAKENPKVKANLQKYGKGYY